MLEGLEIREFQLSDCIKNKDYRIDTDYYIKSPLKNKNLTYKRIGDCLMYSQYGISIEMNEVNRGYPIYRMNEIHDMLCDIETNKYADIDKETFEIFRLNNKDVLFNRTNSYDFVGRTGVYYDNDGIERTFASYLVKFVPNSSVILPEYLAAYLNTKQGVWDIKRRARQSINQTNVNPEEVKEMDIPILSMGIQKAIQDRVVLANSLRCQADCLYKGVEERMSETFGANRVDNSQNNKNIVKFKNSFLVSGRFDAEYYQPQYDELFKLLEQFDTQMLGELVAITKSVEPGSNYYLTEGVPFVRVADLTKFGITKPSIYLDNEIFKDVIRPKQDTILMSKDGSIGIAYKVEKDENFITSGAILHLQIIDDNILPDYLTLVINSKVVQMQAERDSGGSIIQHWKPSEISNVVIPILPMEKQLEISQLVQESFRLRNESKRLLNVSKTAVEIAIGESENTALNYLKENGNG